MKRPSFLVISLLLLTLVVVGTTADEVYSQAGAPQPSITLSPTSGFSAITIAGVGFFGGEITIYWEEEPIPTVPSPLYGSDTQDGSFTAIISMPTQIEPGEYIITAQDQERFIADATFTVIDMTGPQGLPGEPGPAGEPGPGAGMSIIAIILAVIAIGLAVFGRIKKWIIG